MRLLVAFDRLIRDRIVCRSLDGETITHSALMLKQAEEICLTEESASKDRDAIMKPISLELKKKPVSQNWARMGEIRGFPGLTKQVDMQKKKLSVETFLDQQT